MKLAVFGANGPTGRLLTQLALDEDHDVVAFTRHPDAFPIEHERLEVAAGDVQDAAAVAAAIDGTDAVISTLGVPFAKTAITVYSDGIANIIAGMHAAGIKRLVCVSSSALAPHLEPLGGFVFEKIMQPYVVNKLGKTLYDDMRRMEAMVSAGDLAWTIVRPSGLFEAPAVSAYGVEIDHIGHRFTARIDLADCLLRQVLGDTHARAAIAVATPSAEQRRPTDALDVVDDPFDPRALNPSNQVTLVDNITLAMHSLLERLTPAERTSFVLHDVFQYSFEDVATIVGRSPTASRQLASRARRTLQAESATGRFPVDSALQRQLSERFIDACEGGDLDGLLALLDPAVEGAGDTAPRVLVGAARVVPGILRYLGPPASPTLLHLPVGDRVGIVALRDHRVLALVLLTIDNGLVVHVDALAGAGPRAAVSAALGLR